MYGTAKHLCAVLASGDPFSLGSARHFPPLSSRFFCTLECLDIRRDEISRLDTGWFVLEEKKGLDMFPSIF